MHQKSVTLMRANILPTLNKKVFESTKQQSLEEGNKEPINNNKLKLLLSELEQIPGKARHVQ